MSQIKLTRLAGILLMASGVLLLVWWILLGVLLPSAPKEMQLVNLVLNKWWLGVNIIGLIGSVLLPLGLIGLYAKQYDKIGIFGLVGFIMAFIGSILYTCLQFDETFMWPIIAVHAPTLLNIKGPMLTNSAFFIAYALMGILFIIGFILISIVSILKAKLPRIANIFLLIGAILFGGGGKFVPLVPRTIGITLFTIALCWLGISIFRDLKDRKMQSHQMPQSSIGDM